MGRREERRGKRWPGTQVHTTSRTAVQLTSPRSSPIAPPPRARSQRWAAGVQRCGQATDEDEEVSLPLQLHPSAECEGGSDVGAGDAAPLGGLRPITALRPRASSPRRAQPPHLRRHSPLLPVKGGRSNADATPLRHPAVAGGGRRSLPHDLRTFSSDTSFALTSPHPCRTQLYSVHLSPHHRLIQ